MKGKHTLRIQSAHLRFDMEFTRNITIIQGDSATGKTTFVDMVQEYLLNGEDTGIALTCDVPCRVVAGITWQDQLAGIEDSIVFIDEGNRFVASMDFAKTIRGSSNYYVIVTRESLDNLPYSVTEIYGLKSSGKFNSLEPVYHEMYRIYGGEILEPDKEGVLLIEDSNAGFDFFSGITEGKKTECISAGGAGNIFRSLQNLQGNVTVIADGAAFGSQMGRIYQLIHKKNRIRLYLPESFEWIILSSGVLEDKEIVKMLKEPYEYIDYREYFSWEQFFTALLVEKSRGSWLQYSKDRLNPVYLKGKCREQIINVLPEKMKRILDDSDS